MAGSADERDGYVSAGVVAQHLGLRPNTVIQWARVGRIPCLKMSPRVIRFRLPAVVAALRADQAIPADAPGRETSS